MGHECMGGSQKQYGGWSENVRSKNAKLWPKNSGPLQKSSGLQPVVDYCYRTRGVAKPPFWEGCHSLSTLSLRKRIADFFSHPITMKTVHSDKTRVVDTRRVHFFKRAFSPILQETWDPGSYQGMPQSQLSGDASSSIGLATASYVIQR